MDGTTHFSIKAHVAIDSRDDNSVTQRPEYGIPVPVLKFTVYVTTKGKWKLISSLFSTDPSTTNEWLKHPVDDQDKAIIYSARRQLNSLNGQVNGSGEGVCIGKPKV